MFLAAAEKQNLSAKIPPLSPRVPFIPDCMCHYRFKSRSLGAGAYSSKQRSTELWQTQWTYSRSSFGEGGGSFNCTHET